MSPSMMPGTLCIGDADAVIGDAPIGEIVSANFLGTLAGSHLQTAISGLLGLRLLEFEFIEPRAENSERLDLVLELTAFILTLHH